MGAVCDTGFFRLRPVYDFVLFDYDLIYYKTTKDL